MNVLKTVLLSLTLAAGLSGTAAADMVNVDFDNWRNIYMNSQYSNGGSSNTPYFYSLHTPNQENLFLGLDLSSYAGGTALGDATVSMYIENGFNYGTNFTVEMRQLNQYNTDLDLDTAGSYFKDGSTQWVDNAGNALANLNYTYSVFDVTSGLLASTAGTSPEPQPGSLLTFTIGQADVQSWLDDPASAVMVMTADNDPYLSMTFDMTQSFVQMDIDAPAGSNDVPAPVGLLLLSLSAIGFTKRRKK